MSTKSGGPLAGAWALMHYLGQEGYGDIVGPVMDATRKMVDGVNAIDGLRVLGDPEMCMFSFTSDDFNIFELADAVRKRGWYIQPQFSTDQSPANLHITVVHASVPVVDDFLQMLSEAVVEVRGNPNPIDAAAIGEQVRALLSGLGEGAGDQLKAMAGLDGDDLPQEMALINTVMDALPDELAEAMLTDFINDLYV